MKKATARSSAHPARSRVALATSRDWPQLAPDDRVLVGALEQLGIDSEIVVWTDAHVDWSRFDLIVVRSCWDYHDDLGRWLSWVAHADHRGRLCNPQRVLTWNARKTYLAELEAAGVLIVPTRWIAIAELQSLDSLARALAACPWQELVCKPAVSAGALGTFRLRRDELPPAGSELAAALPELARRGPLLVQPFVPEIGTQGEQSLLFFGGRFSHAVVKIPAPGDFRVQEKHGGRTRPVQATPSVRATAERTLAAACRLNALDAPSALLYARLDVVASGEDLLLMELELTEPALFLDQALESQPASLPAHRFAEAIARRIAELR
jgi:glutathione synthase/RimK-type ligase-like ATP-grasp enzyme